INRARIECGLELITPLLRNDILKYYRDDQGEYMLKVHPKGEKIADEIFFSMDVSGLPCHTQPSFVKPDDRYDFSDYFGGDLIKVQSYSGIRKMKYAACPLIYDIINKIQGVEYQVNTKVLNVAKALDKHPILTYKGLKLPAKALLGKQRENSFIITKADTYAGKKFYHYYSYGFRGRIYCSSHFFN
ncbi:MAG: hypothetical protein MPK62_12880, partial [Alphaproteobacteria bacterium]|nr:hypothetical protein [Alphaproteobacteria bacterium]